MLGIQCGSGGSLVATKGLGFGGGERVLLSLLFGGVLKKFLLSSDCSAVTSVFLAFDIGLEVGDFSFVRRRR